MGQGIKISKSNFSNINYEYWKNSLPGGRIDGDYDSILIPGVTVYPLANAVHNVEYVTEVGDTSTVYLESDQAERENRIIWNSSHSASGEFSGPVEEITGNDSMEDVDLYAKWVQYIYKSDTNYNFNKRNSNILIDSGDIIFSWAEPVE